MAKLLPKNDHFTLYSSLRAGSFQNTEIFPPIIKINQNNDIIIKNVFDDNEKWNQKSIYFPDDDYKYFTLKDNAGKIKEYCENQHIQKRNNNHLYSKTNHRIMFFCVEFAPFICYSHQNIQDLLQPHE